MFGTAHVRDLLLIIERGENTNMANATRWSSTTNTHIFTNRPSFNYKRTLYRCLCTNAANFVQFMQTFAFCHHTNKAWFEV